MSKTTGFILLGIAAVLAFPAQFYLVRHPRHSGEPVGGRRTVAAVVIAAAMSILIGLMVIVIVISEGR